MNELDELRAEVRTYHDRAMASEADEAGWQDRAEAAEAKVARVERLASFGPVFEGESESDPYYVRLEDLRAALAGPEPEATDWCRGCGIGHVYGCRCPKPEATEGGDA